jgi:hypothetical protein
MTTDASGLKIFTVHEAQRVVDEIRPLVERMLQAFTRMREEIEAASASAGLRPAHPDLARHLEDRGVAPQLLQEINSVIQSIQEHGCVVNGPEAGLVDFPCLLDGEIVYLCWKHGEPRIGHWHRIPDGFAGRRPLLDPGAHPGDDPRIH